MIAKKSAAKTDLKDEIRRLMTPESAKELAGLSLTFQQFLIRWIDLRDVVIKDEILETVSTALMKDSIDLSHSVAETVCKQVAETIAPIWGKLEVLADTQKEIMDTLNKMNKRMGEMEKRVYQIDAKRFRIIEKRITQIAKALEQHLKDNIK